MGRKLVPGKSIQWHHTKIAEISFFEGCVVGRPLLVAGISLVFLSVAACFNGEVKKACPVALNVEQRRPDDGPKKDQNPRNALNQVEDPEKRRIRDEELIRHVEEIRRKLAAEKRQTPATELNAFGNEEAGVSGRVWPKTPTKRGTRTRCHPLKNSYATYEPNGALRVNRPTFPPVWAPWRGSWH